MFSVSQEEHPDVVANILKANKSLAKEARRHLREIAQLLALKYHNTMPFDPVACVHWEDGEPGRVHEHIGQLMSLLQRYIGISL